MGCSDGVKSSEIPRVICKKGQYLDKRLGSKPLNMCPFCLLMLIWPHADFLKICAVIQAGLFFFFFKKQHGRNQDEVLYSTAV